ncbi:11330_t:CDS:2, partial [Racocetra persica]
TQMAREIQKIYDDPNCLLSWPKVLIIDKGTKYIAVKKSLEGEKIFADPA